MRNNDDDYIELELNCIFAYHTMTTNHGFCVYKSTKARSIKIYFKSGPYTDDYNKYRVNKNNG